LKAAERVGQLHLSVFRCPAPLWHQIEDAHKKILAELIPDGASVLDLGCGYGRLLTLMPVSWYGDYTGVDLSPELVRLAQETYPVRRFYVGDLRYLEDPPRGSTRYDWGVMVSIRPMVRRNAGDDVWADVERRVKSWCRRLLYLEYDPADPGEVVEC
jgi:SAM-dependent methyltransferase